MTGGILQAGAPLISEIKITVGGEMQIVQAFEFLPRLWSGQQGFNFAADGIEDHQAVLTIRDEGAAVFVRFQSVRDAVIFRQHLPFALRRDAIDPPGADIDLIDLLPMLTSRFHDLPEPIQAELFAALDIQVLWNAPQHQATGASVRNDSGRKHKAMLLRGGVHVAQKTSAAKFCAA